jgi:hypothetical protein
MCVLTAEVFDKVLVPVLEQTFLGTGPRVIGTVGRRRYGERRGILFSLALVLDGCRCRVKGAYKFVIDRKNSISS